MHTNNTGELSAVLAALRWLDRQHELMATITNVRIVTDSKYVKNLSRNNWNPAANKALVQTCQSLLRSVELLLPIHIDWTKAHSQETDADTFWNNVADSLADRGVVYVAPSPLPLTLPRVPPTATPAYSSSGDTAPRNPLDARSPAHDPALHAANLVLSAFALPITPLSAMPPIVVTTAPPRVIDDG